MRKAVWTALCVLFCAAPAFAQEYPRVELVYQYIPFDRTCEQWRNIRIDGRQEQLQEIIAWDSAAENPIYGRGWQIVNDIEGHQAFVEELKAFSRASQK
ncbi:MAG: hypothetical protein E6H75_09780 [Betaproteobacteria bacterium]|nr:MAG: hypothetical protein E6H80_05230 [Betaproteobacteria bacterium]TMG75681.1 MAG: hypothetical protein E6H75_09780 [Betaproteobacteria bacterium]